MSDKLKPCHCGYAGELAGTRGTFFVLHCPACLRKVEAITMVGLVEAWNMPVEHFSAVYGAPPVSHPAGCPCAICRASRQDLPPTKNFVEWEGIGGSIARIPTPRLAVVPIGFLDFVRNAPVQSGVCCCGSPMVPANHGDHAAVDQWDHSLSMWLEQIGAMQ